MKQLTPKSLKDSLIHNCGIDTQSSFLLTVSGGLDSMVMLHVFKELGLKFEVAHCNFSLRGEESDADQDFLIDYCSKNKITIFCKVFQTQEYAQENKISIEMAARDLRYAWFKELLEQRPHDYMVTAHHGDDAVETFFLNLVRGTGIRGLSGMSYKNNTILRPLLAFSREQIETYAKNENIPSRHDSSNDETIYTRNKIRHEVIPSLKQINASFLETMTRNMNHLKEVESVLDSEVQGFKDAAVVEEAGHVLIPIKRLLDHPQKASILFEILHPYGFNSAVVDDVLLALKAESGKQFFSETHRLLKDRHNLLLTERKDEEVEHFWLETLQEPNAAGLSYLSYEKPEDFKYSTDPYIAHFDADLIDFPLLVRRWKQGDSFRPLGMRKFKKLSDFFIDEKYSIVDKENAWIVINGEDIIWIVGKRVDDRYKITNRTKQVLELKLGNSSGSASFD